MNNHFTRTASLLLVFGLLFGCSSSLPGIYQARMNMDNEQYDKALRTINKEIEANPGNPEGYYLKGNILFELALDQSNPSNRTSFYEDMRSALMQSRDLYSDSASTMRSVKLNNIDDLLRNGWSHEYRAGLAFIQKDSLVGGMTSSEAIAHFNNAITIIPDSLQPYRHKARILYRDGNHEEAINTLTSILKQYQRPSPATLEQLAYLYQKTGNTERAIPLFEEAFKQNAENSNLAHGLVNAYIESGKHQKAVRLLDTLITRFPRVPSYRISYAGELYHLGALHLDTIRTNTQGPSGNNPAADVDSSRLTMINQHWSQAQDYYRNAREQYTIADTLRPKSAEIDYSVAVFYKNMALDHRYILSTLPPSATRSSDSTVNRYLKTAIGHLESAAQLTPENPQYWSQLYQLYSHFGMKEKAREAREKANL